jgi:hypothetical protein
VKTVSLTLEEFKALPDYSCSVPTGVVVGKRWKRHQPYVRRGACLADEHNCGHWLLGEYVGDDERVVIEWYAIVVRYATGRAPSGPALQQLPAHTPTATLLKTVAVRHVWHPEED